MTLPHSRTTATVRHELVLYTRPHCQLCDEALETIHAVLDARAAAGRPAPVLRIVDIGGDPTLEEAFRERIPVVRFGGAELDLVITPRRLARLLDRVAAGSTASSMA